MEEKDLQKQSGAIQKQVGSLVIVDKESYKMAGEAVINLNELIKKIDQYWVGLVGEAHTTWKSAVAKRDEMLANPKMQRATLKQKANKFLTDEENKRKAAQKILDDDRAKKEAAEKKRLADRIATAEAKGKTEKAEKLRDEVDEVFVPPAIVQPVVEKTTRMSAGTASTSKDINVTIRDEKAVLTHILAGTLPISIVSISLSKLKAALKMHAIKQLDGVIIEPAVKGSFRSK